MISTLTIPLLSGTCHKPHKPKHDQSFRQEPSSPSRSDALIAVPDKTKISALLTRKWLIMNNAQCLTMCKFKLLKLFVVK